MLSPRPCQQVKADKETDKEEDKEKEKEDEDSGHLAAPSWVTEIRQNELFRKVRQKIDTDWAKFSCGRPNYPVSIYPVHAGPEAGAGSGLVNIKYQISFQSFLE